MWMNGMSKCRGILGPSAAAMLLGILLGGLPRLASADGAGEPFDLQGLIDKDVAAGPPPMLSLPEPHVGSPRRPRREA